MLRKWPWESASAEVETDAGDENSPEKDNDEVKTEAFVGADLLMAKVWPCDSIEAEMLLSVWHVMFKQKKSIRKTTEKQDKQRSMKETLCTTVDVASYWACACQKTADLWH